MNGQDLRDAALPVVVGIGFLALWEAVVRIQGIPHYILPAPSLVAATLWKDLPSLLPSLWFTVRITIASIEPIPNAPEPAPVGTRAATAMR